MNLSSFEPDIWRRKAIDLANMIKYILNNNGDSNSKFVNISVLQLIYGHCWSVLPLWQWVEVPNFQDPELYKFKSYSLHQAF